MVLNFLLKFNLFFIFSLFLRMSYLHAMNYDLIYLIFPPSNFSHVCPDMHLPVLCVCHEGQFMMPICTKVRGYLLELEEPTSGHTFKTEQSALPCLCWLWLSCSSKPNCCQLIIMTAVSCLDYSTSSMPSHPPVLPILPPFLLHSLNINDSGVNVAVRFRAEHSVSCF